MLPSKPEADTASADGWASFIAWDKLCLAWRRAASGKRGGAAVARLAHAAGVQLVRLQAALQQGCWQPGGYVSFAIHEPKRRWISAAPFADRVVHHALLQVIEPRFERSFIACRWQRHRGALMRCQRAGT